MVLVRSKYFCIRTLHDYESLSTVGKKRDQVVFRYKFEKKSVKVCRYTSSSISRNFKGKKSELCGRVAKRLMGMETRLAHFLCGFYTSSTKESSLRWCFRHPCWGISGEQLLFKSICCWNVGPKEESVNCVLRAGCSFQIPKSRC